MRILGFNFNLNWLTFGYPNSQLEMAAKYSYRLLKLTCKRLGKATKTHMALNFYYLGILSPNIMDAK